MGPNLETSDDSTGNGLAIFLMERDHLENIQRTERQVRKLELLNGSVSGNGIDAQN